ncbi:unnamed protein product [Acanthocheilonema viteae]|uniref:CUE domain-containing protein n=1 Tax=Acanthocheilonema viteae TaxID=6277 RepID=A0A498SNY6_ACAVI|nr:unnamed protein product [Acanthocheilonema viteae]
MPLIALDPFDGLLAVARHTSVPTLNSYIIISLLLTIGSAFYAKLTFTKDEIENRLSNINETFRKTDPASALITSAHFQQFYYILLHPTFGWVFINMFCAFLALIAKLVTHAAVGKLGAQESVLLRERLCNFLLYKAVFLFGVLNSVVHEEVIAWVLWFALLASVAALQSIIAYKLKYVRCLRSWLEQDNSCPTCRLALPSSSNPAVIEGSRERSRVPIVQLFGHVFHFSGTRYARWLPSFSVELSHNVTPNFFQRNRFGSLANSQLNSLAEQVREMFPQLEMAAILEDLRESGSVQATVENILDSRFRQQNIALDSDEEIWNGVDSPSSSNSSTESSGEYEETLMPSGSCFGSCSIEHRDIFLQKKDALIQHHRK